MLPTPEAEAATQRFCADCGGPVRTRRAACGYALGVARHRGETRRDTTYTALDYCAGCGRPHPWLSREGALDGLILAVRGDANLGQPERLNLPLT
jgi:hypothetical protein